MTHKRKWHRPRPAFGQHFLVSLGVRARLLGHLSPRPDDCWLEIGAGQGEITVELARTARALAAVERDPTLAATLRTRLAPYPQARVVEADILETSLGQVAAELGCSRLRVYGSLPYYITSPILRLLFSALDHLTDIHAVVQREVADRLVARPGSRAYGYLSVETQFYTQAEILLRIPRGAFRPPPQVDSALVRLVPPGQQANVPLHDPPAFLRFVGTCFQQKRKTLRNNLSRLYSSSSVEAALAAAGLSPRARAEEQSVEQFARLYGILSGCE